MSDFQKGFRKVAIGIISSVIISALLRGFAQGWFNTILHGLSVYSLWFLGRHSVNVVICDFGDHFHGWLDCGSINT